MSSANHNIVIPAHAGIQGYKHRRRLWFWIPACAGMTVMVLMASALAATPVPPKTEKLEKIKEQLGDQKQTQEQLKVQLHDADQDLKQTRDSLVKAAQSARASEQKLQALEAQIADLTKQSTALNTELERNQGSLGSLILALTRLHNAPPGLLLIHPEAPLQSAETETLLHNILPALDKHAAALQQNLKALSDNLHHLQQDRAAALATKKNLDEKYKAVAALMAKRGDLYKSLDSHYAENQAAIEDLSQHAQSMQDFMDRLSRKRQKEEESPTTNGASPAPIHAYNWEMPKPGHPELPVPGNLLTAFGQMDRFGARSQGLTLQSSPGTLVVAPMGGVVRFAGAFKNYGRLVILEHQDGYISLLAGFDSVDAPLGQSLSAGEPVGKLPNASSRGGPPTLYYELRYKGRPVNPAEKFPDLKAKS